MNKLLVCIFATMLSCSALSANGSVSSKEALVRLMRGNERYVKEMLEHPNRSIEHIESMTQGQAPFAVVLGCSDSRVSPVIIFDQGLGDIFEVRVAGNVAGPIEIASIEFGALVLGARLIFVLGHENCAAVRAALENNTKNIEPITDNIQVAIKAIPNASKSLENAVKGNVKWIVQELRKNPLMAKLIDDQKVEIVGGYYNLQTGRVDLCCDQPLK